MYIKVNEEGKIIAACSIKADDSFIETTVNNFDLSNFDYFVKDNNIVTVEKEKEEIAIEIELAELENWFKWYDNQVAQYNRCQRLGIEFDKDINELDNQAKINQERIAEIRKIKTEV